MKNYLDAEYLKQNMMGPNSVKMLAELVQGLKLENATRILDLGCGRGLTSMYLADNFPAPIFAMDLWISASENNKRFQELGMENKVIPIHADATCPPFADEYFDAVVSVDSYHYFGRDEQYLDCHLAPLVKKGGVIALCFPGLKKELSMVPKEMSLSWTSEDIDTWHSCTWWKEMLSHSKMIEIVSISEMNCFEECWKDWLSSDNPYAVSDRRAMEAGAGKYMNFISVVCRRV
ncbi:SAM-dependent methyltransferase [Sporolactobacillus pectinivorans]|uniref:SAM-dependent methyltransferase n=1 Tax=Sporolactobacillus pectinivorans TaxID=1591408 RepID=UPI000C266CF5|nr:methyltransferase domain-containing protein [Sporolactobacillus pectinivorans]